MDGLAKAVWSGLMCENHINIWLYCDGVPGRTRTRDPLLRRQLLYPPELQGRLDQDRSPQKCNKAWKPGQGINGSGSDDLVRTLWTVKRPVKLPRRFFIP